MNSYFKKEAHSIRQISDLKFGMPISVEATVGNALIFSIETLNSIEVFAYKPTNGWEILKEDEYLT